MDVFRSAARSKGTATVSLGFFCVFGATRYKSTYVLRTPPPSASRGLPTPLVFVSCKAWDRRSHVGIPQTASMFAERGYTCLEVDIDTPETESAESAIKVYESELRQQIRLAGIPFPPVIFARSAAAIIAQQYVSSNPASGLVLTSPPVNNATLVTHGDAMYDMRSLREFDFEARFPIVIFDSIDREASQKETNRLVRDEGVELIVVMDMDSQEALVRIEQWLDQNGM